MGPTKDIMRVRITDFQWHEFFPRGNEHEDTSFTCYLIHRKEGDIYNFLVYFAAKNNIGVVIALWAPIILVWVPILLLFQYLFRSTGVV